jgi:hypothetical protein
MWRQHCPLARWIALRQQGDHTSAALSGGGAPSLDTMRTEGMTVTIVDAARPVTGGVDTHLDLNVAAALDAIGGLLAVAEFPTTSAGHRALLGWLSGFGRWPGSGWRAPALMARVCRPRAWAQKRASIGRS